MFVQRELQDNRGSLSENGCLGKCGDFKMQRVDGIEVCYSEEVKLNVGETAARGKCR